MAYEHGETYGCRRTAPGGCMSDDETDAEEALALSVDSLRERIDALYEQLEDAETEADLDDVESQLEAVEAEFEDADLPEPEDEDDEDPAAELESDLESVAEELEEQRGPYAEDAIEDLEAASAEIADTQWTEKGEAELRAVVKAALTDINELLGTALSLEDDAELADSLIAALEATGTAIDEESLDADEDAEAIESLLEATTDLQDGVDDAQAWDDLSVREKLEAQGYYAVLEHIKDFPPEWHALKVHERQGNVEMVLLALETFDSDFMERHALEALERMGPEEAIEPMVARAGKRDKQAISILGKIGVADEEGVETLVEYVDAQKDPLLQKVTFRALGEMGAESAVQPIANQLLAENAEVRSAAARALGLLGDTRAIKPLVAALADDGEDTVRASAAWALRQIGTEAALKAVAGYTDDRAFLVQAEAEKAI